MRMTTKYTQGCRYNQTFHGIGKILGDPVGSTKVF